MLDRGRLPALFALVLAAACSGGPADDELRSLEEAVSFVVARHGDTARLVDLEISSLR